MSIGSSQAQQKWKNFTFTGNANSIFYGIDSVFVATSGGLVSLNNGFADFNISNRGNSKIRSNDLLDFLIDADGRKWFLHTDRLSYNYEGTWQDFTLSGGELHLNREGGLIHINKNGIHTWNGIDFDSVAYPLPMSNLVDIEYDVKEDEFWFIGESSDTSRFMHYVDNQWTLYDAKGGILPDDMYRAQIYKDPRGIIWALSSFNRVYQFDGASWFCFKFKAGVEVDQVKCTDKYKNGQRINC